MQEKTRVIKHDLRNFDLWIICERICDKTQLRPKRKFDKEKNILFICYIIFINFLFNLSFSLQGNFLIKHTKPKADWCRLGYSPLGKRFSSPLVLIANTHRLQLVVTIKL